MKVRATRVGYYGLQRRYEGDVFNIKSEKQFSNRWMEKVASSEAKEAREPKETKKRGRPPKTKSEKPTGDTKVI